MRKGRTESFGERYTEIKREREREGNMYVYINIHIYIYLSICIYICIYIYWQIFIYIESKMNQCCMVSLKVRPRGNLYRYRPFACLCKNNKQCWVWVRASFCALEHAVSSFCCQDVFRFLTDMTPHAYAYEKYLGYDAFTWHDTLALACCCPLICQQKKTRFFHVTLRRLQVNPEILFCTHTHKQKQSAAGHLWVPSTKK